MTPKPPSEARALAIARGKAIERQGVIANVAAVVAFLLLGVVPLIVLTVWSPNTHPRQGGRGPGPLLGLVPLPGLLIALYLRRRLLADEPPR